MRRKLENESDRPEDWQEDVLYVRNPDGTITVITEEGEASAENSEARRHGA